MNISDVVRTLVSDGFVLVFNQSRMDVVKTAQALKQAGINNMEVTCRIENPLDRLKELRRELPEFVGGIASLVDYPEAVLNYNRRNPDDLLPSVDSAVEAGAHFLVSAGNFRTETYKKYSGKRAILPGCGTVSEILDQYSKGANITKVFPAKQLGGPGFIKAVDSATHRLIPMMPTGGTNKDNLGDYISNGVLVVGGSFSIIEPRTREQIIERQDYELLAQEMKKLKQMIDEVRFDVWPDIDFEQAPLKEISYITGRDFNLG